VILSVTKKGAPEASRNAGRPGRGVAQEKLYKMMRDHQAKGTCSHTFGALDTVQVRNPMVLRSAEEAVVVIDLNKVEILVYSYCYFLFEFLFKNVYIIYCYCYGY
jgi:hypothetical protein